MLMGQYLELRRVSDSGTLYALRLFLAYQIIRSKWRSSKCGACAHSLHGEEPDRPSFSFPEIRRRFGLFLDQILGIGLERARFAEFFFYTGEQAGHWSGAGVCEVERAVYGHCS
jgi:hypothetical protein